MEQWTIEVWGIALATLVGGLVAAWFHRTHVLEQTGYNLLSLSRIAASGLAPLAIWAQQAEGMAFWLCPLSAALAVLFLVHQCRAVGVLHGVLGYLAQLLTLSMSVVALFLFVISRRRNRAF